MQLPVPVNAGKQPGDGWFSHQYGIQVFDLSANQICSLLENADPEKGIDHARLGATPTIQYQVIGGGRFFQSVSREEIAQAMQGVDILVTIVSSSPWFHDFMAQEFVQCLTSDDLLDNCKAVIVRIVRWKSTSTHAKPQTVDSILRMIGLDVLDEDKLYVLADKEVSQGECKSRRKSKKIKLDEDVTTAIAQLRSQLLGEEIKEVVTAPVKETVSAGKALLGMGQRLTSWVTSFIKSYS